MPHHNEQSVRVLRTVCIFRSYDGKSENSDKIISAFTCLPTRSLCDARDLCWSHPVPPIQTPFKTHSSAPRLTANRRIDNAPHNPPRLPAFIRSTVDTVLLISRSCCPPHRRGVTYSPHSDTLVESGPKRVSSACGSLLTQYLNKTQVRATRTLRKPRDLASNGRDKPQTKNLFEELVGRQNLGYVRQAVSGQNERIAGSSLVRCRVVAQNW